MFLLPKEVLMGKFKKMVESIKCPYCENGNLILKTEDAISASISHIFDSKYWGDWLEENSHGCSEYRIFSNHFECNNLNCNESAIITGVSYYQLDDIKNEYIDEIGEYGPSYYYEDRITIKHIEPPIDLFSIPVGLKTSLELVYELKKAFYLFWIDKDACANKIRRFVELLLDEMKIQPAYNLHQRIEKYMQKSSNRKTVSLGNKLMAIKWIGNQGSHLEQELTNENIITAFEILENVLHKIYDKSEKLIAQKVKQINKNKKI